MVKKKDAEKEAEETKEKAEPVMEPVMEFVPDEAPSIPAAIKTEGIPTGVRTVCHGIKAARAAIACIEGLGLAVRERYAVGLWRQRREGAGYAERFISSDAPALIPRCRPMGRKHVFVLIDLDWGSEEIEETNESYVVLVWPSPVARTGDEDEGDGKE